jgi:hypothetical protein
MYLLPDRFPQEQEKRAHQPCFLHWEIWTGSIISVSYGDFPWTMGADSFPLGPKLALGNSWLWDPNRSGPLRTGELMQFCFTALAIG